MVNEPEVRARFEMLAPFLNERTRRLAAAAEAAAIGRGGITRVSRATGVSRRAIASGLAQLKAPDDWDEGRIRRPGGGRKRTVDTDATLRSDLERLIDPVTRGDPESPLRWTCKSIRKLAEELQRSGHATSHRMVAELLCELGYSLQANRKTIEGGSHPDSQRPIRAHQPQGPGRAEGRRAGHLGGRQEEGTGRRFQARGPGVAPGGGPGTRPRL